MTERAELPPVAAALDMTQDAARVARELAVKLRADAEVLRPAYERVYGKALRRAQDRGDDHPTEYASKVARESPEGVAYRLAAVLAATAEMLWRSCGNMVMILEDRRSAGHD